MEKLDLSKIKKIFFIGIGGIGISALAKMAISRGIEVTGVNDEDSPKTLDPLRELGVRIIFLKDLKEIPEADLYVYSDAWPYRGPEIIAQAKATGKPVLSYFEALGEIAKEYKVIAISGTHGKTTTTAMVAEVLIEAGLDPTVIVGSFVKKFGSNFREGKGEYLVVEADEFNRHLLNFHPFIGVVTNAETDHFETYKNLDEIKETFDKFIKQSEHGVTSYESYLEKVPKLSVPGVHNRMNAAASLAVAEMLGIKEEIAQKALAGFQGTWRRLEKIGKTTEGTIIYDDYAHHPTEVRASLEALRELYPKGEKHIHVLFQPHLYSRTKALFEDFTECFDQADNVFLLPIYFARESPDPSVSSEKLAEAIRLHRGEAVAFADFTAAEACFRKMTWGEKDVFVTMGAGEAYKVAEVVFKVV